MPSSPFDTWTEPYDRWFTTPIGRLVYAYESELLLELLDPQPGERILDAGCGSGIFTGGVLARGATVVGLDLSLPMLHAAIRRHVRARFLGLYADLSALPCADGCFDRVWSMTAIEFIEDAARTLAELERVTRPGGTIVVTTLNSLSPWAEERTQKGRAGHELFSRVFFRSPDEMRALIGSDCVVRTAVHFRKGDPVDQVPALERAGHEAGSDRGALLAVKWLRGMD
jgi:ubiquinone/menaquinone biosynthesis C-methylase UbiE